jgi:predicted DNA-binding ribbon-helix-helix protein
MDYETSINKNLDRIDNQFLITLALQLNRRKTMKMISEINESKEENRNAKIRVVCKRIIREKLNKQNKMFVI